MSSSAHFPLSSAVSLYSLTGGVKDSWSPAVGPDSRGIEEPLGKGRIGVDAAVAEEGPVAAGLLLELGVAGGDDDLFGIVPGAREDSAEGIGQERAAPELQAAAGRSFVADPVDG